MKVILIQHVRGLGQKGEIKEVSDGYFRNALAPRKLARPATGGAVKAMQNQKAKATEKLQNMKESAMAVKERVEGKSITLTEKASDTGKLYASVSQKEVAAALKSDLKVSVPIKSIIMDEHIKEAGAFKVKLNLFKGVTASFTLNVQSQ